MTVLHPNSGNSDSLSAALTTFLGGLCGQWIEETFIEGNDSDTPTRTRIVTSRGHQLAAHTARISSREIQDRDSPIYGFVITATRLDPDGSMRWALAWYSDPSRTEALRVSPPWTLRGLCGEAVAASIDGRIGHHPATGFRFATPEALRTWASSPRTNIDFEILDYADADWVQTYEVVGALVEAGITDDDELLRRSIDITAGLLVRGDLVAGMIGDDGFEQTSEPLPELIERIATTWTFLGTDMHFGSICWFSITDTGREHLYAARPHLRT